MKADNKTLLLQLLKQHKELGISNQIDYDKFYLYSIITHSTAIEGSTVTEVEALLLFDEGITAKGKPMVEQLMNLAEKFEVEYDGWGTYFEDPNGEDGEEGDDEDYVDEDDDGVRH